MFITPLVIQLLYLITYLENSTSMNIWPANLVVPISYLFKPSWDGKKRLINRD